MTVSAATGKTSADLLGITSYETNKSTAASSKSSNEMGKQDFLTLFTAQLKSQNPLDPVKNEAFVAQLAQFSQLEAMTNMQTSMAATRASHYADGEAPDADGLRYRIPFNTAMDGNTVEMSVEQAQYGKAAAQYQATLSFLENRVSGIRKALRGE